MNDKDPGLVAICGEWHGNARWGREVIKQISTLLPIWQKKIILQAGDFGVWDPPGEVKWHWDGKEKVRDSYLTEIENALAHANAELWFVDGNHENHPLLAELTRDGPYLTPHIKHLSRGTRWKWHGLSWLALGGAVSVDKNQRREGISWFPEEEITLEQVGKVIREGKTDVLLSHDAPSWVPLELGTPPRQWESQILFAEAHRALMSDICLSVQPSLIFHGHYHVPANQFLSAPWGECRVISLDTDGTSGNWGLLNLESMTWEILQPPLLAESMSTQILVIAEMLPLKLTVAGAQPFQLPGLNLRCLPQAEGASTRKHPCHPDDQGHPQPPQQACGPGRGIPDHPPVLVCPMPDQVRPTAGEKRGTGDYCMENVTAPRIWGLRLAHLVILSSRRETPHCARLFPRRRKTSEKKSTIPWKRKHESIHPLRGVATRYPHIHRTCHHRIFPRRRIDGE